MISQQVAQGLEALGAGRDSAATHGLVPQRACGSRSASFDHISATTRASSSRLPMASRTFYWAGTSVQTVGRPPCAATFPQYDHPRIGGLHRIPYDEPGLCFLPVSFKSVAIDMSRKDSPVFRSLRSSATGWSFGSGAWSRIWRNTKLSAPLGQMGDPTFRSSLTTMAAATAAATIR